MVLRAPEMDLSTPRLAGEVHPAYVGARPEVLGLVPESARRILDVGCSAGLITAPRAAAGDTVVGVEFDPFLAAEARKVLTEVLEADVEHLVIEDESLGEPFDCVIFADVLEHLRNPWAAVRWAAGQLRNGGSIVVSVPNVRHLETFWTLAVRARWPYKDVGIFDRTHLRFFARRNLPDLFEGTGLEIVELRRSYVVRLNKASVLNRMAARLGDFGTLQFILRAERSPTPAVA